jgi:hypothetical protein
MSPQRSTLSQKESFFFKRYGFIKAWRAKIFAKIEWKDTSKNAREDTNHTLLSKKSKK